MLVPWRFSVYVRSDGKEEVQSEVERLDEYGLEHLNAAVRYLATVAKAEWKRPHARKLSGQGDLYEIRFKGNRTQVRALGVFGPGFDEFTITLVASKKGDVYKPRDAFAIADKRWSQIRAGSASCSPLKIDGEVVPPILE